jgi:hypothetical protein
MESGPRHQCVIYEGSPAKHLRGLAALVIDNLKDDRRCLVLDAPAMIAGMRSYLAAAGLDVRGAVHTGSLVLSSDQSHLINGQFDPRRMLEMLRAAVSQALNDGYKGLWATGDMSWELGNESNFSKLLEYECGLENLFRALPELSGICQYHSDTLPTAALETALYTHRAVYTNETLSRMNPYYRSTGSLPHSRARVSGDEIVQMLEFVRLPPQV